MIYEDITTSATYTVSIARNVFAWILAAQRPLSAAELRSVVAHADEGTIHNDLDTSIILDIYRNLLIHVTGESSIEQTLQFAQLSVREFLVDHPDFYQRKIHTTAVRRCLLEFNQSPAQSPGSYGHLISDGTPFREYTPYLFEHASLSDLANEKSSLAPAMISFLFDCHYQLSTSFKAWEDVVISIRNCHLLPDKDDTLRDKLRWIETVIPPSSIICLYGLLSVVRLLTPIEGFPWKRKEGLFDEVGAVHAACSTGHLQVAKELLEKNIFAPDDADRHVTALYTAALHGEHDIVKLLLEHGANPMIEFDGVPSDPASRRILWS